MGYDGYVINYKEEKMTITLEQIDNLRERTHVSYGQAKEALEISDGHMIDAIIYLENEKESFQDVNHEEKNSRQRHKKEFKKTSDEFVLGFKKVIKLLNETRFIMFNEDRTIFDISMTITLLAAMFVFPLTMTILIIGLLTGNRFKIKKKSKLSESVNDIFDKASKMTDEVKNSFKSDDMNA